MKLQVSLAEISFVVMTKANMMKFLDWLETERGNSVNSRNQRLFALKSFFNLNYSWVFTNSTKHCLNY